MAEAARWRDTTLGEICAEGGGGVQTGPFGSQLHARDYVESGIPSVMPQNIGDNVIVEGGIARISPADADRLSKYLLREGDIVYSRRGDVEKRALVRKENDGWLCGTGCLRVRLGDDSPHDSRFVSYQLRTDEARTWIRRHAVGATMPNLNTSILSAVPMRVPDGATQRAVSEVLGALDDKIAANLLTAEIAGALARALFDEATASAARVSFSSRHTPVLGGTPPRSNTSFWGGSHLWISATDVTGADHGVVIDTKEKISEEAVTKTKAKPLPRGSVILTARGTVGAVARLAEPASFNQSAYGFRPNGLPPALLYFSVLDAAKQAVNFVHGSVFDTITMRTFDDLKIPDLDFSFADALETKLSALLAIVEHAVRENVTLAATRDALLPGLMSGKLRVKDAERLAESLA